MADSIKKRLSEEKAEETKCELVKKIQEKIRLAKAKTRRIVLERLRNEIVRQQSKAEPKVEPNGTSG